MSSSFLSRLRQLTDRHRPAPFDPSIFKDPLASETGWNSCSRSSSNFRTRRLSQTTAERMTFRPSMSAILFALVFLGVPVGVLAGFRAPLGQPLAHWDQSQWFILGFAAIFGGVALLSGLFFFRPIVFDRRNGFYWKGFRPPHALMRPEVLKNAAPLAEVRALQILSSYRSGSNGYMAYELNLVLQDARRLPVLCHAKGQALKSEAERLGRFLGVPVWDAS